ncbi:O-methyltransferase [Fonsecaea pedrosoi]|nr:O-methyltransferase [Fonsecaea pedrosoi]
MSNPGAILASTVTSIAALGFIPVAIHFNFFPLLNRIGPIATAEELTKASDAERSDEDKRSSPLCLRLTEDTMFAMAGLGLVDLVDDTTYQVNPITAHMAVVPSSLHGMLHFTTEPLWAAAFLMRQLRDTNFEYPFQENKTPTQYGYKLIGEERFANEHTYSIMNMQGRMPSFSAFMEGKFGRFGTMPFRVQSFGYDLGSILRSEANSIAIVDIGGGRGEMLLEVKAAYPHLKKENLVLQEFNPDQTNADELTIQHWDFKNESPQPVKGALMYSLTHIYHNLSDLEALRLMKKVSDAMAPYSCMLIHEFAKKATYGKMHATMIQLYAGRIRSSREWKQMAALAGLEVTFETYPVAGEGLVEMRKLGSSEVTNVTE